MDVKKQGLLQALGVSLYCLVVGTFFGQANKFLPKPDTAFTPVSVLILFSASALICGLIVFYKPYRLFFEGKKKEAIDVVVYTAIGLIIAAILAFFLLLL